MKNTRVGFPIQLFLCVALTGFLASCTPSDPNPTARSEAPPDTAGGAAQRSSDEPPPDSETNDGQNQDATTEVASKKPPLTVTDAGDSATIVISFDDIDLPIDADMVFRPFMMTDRAQSLDGKRVRINGFMLADAKTRGIKEFILVKNTECKFGPGGQADHLVNVKVNIDNGVIHRVDAVSIEGVLSINPFTGFDGNTWSIFDMECDRVEKYKPRR